jgi:HAMP domain-containing protein
MEQVSELKTSVNALTDATNRLGSSNAVITINGGGAIALVVGFIGILGIVIAVAAVLVVSAWRAADMSKLQTVRDDMDMANAYITQHEKRLNKLETVPK